MFSKTISCYRCKIEFAVPDYWYSTRIQDHNSFWCPNGHQQHFFEGESDETKLRRERDVLKQKLAEKDDTIAFERKGAEAARRKLKRVERRANAGVCQCCNRTFANVARHMASKHPELAKPRLAEKVG